MTDGLIAQRILHDWAVSKGFSSTIMNERLYFHSQEYNEFAFVDFTKIPKITLVVSNKPSMASFMTWSDVSIPPGAYSNYELNLAEEKVFIQIERILERTIEAYGR